MIVECYDEKGSEVYDMVVRYILQDVQIYRAIKGIRIYMDPREPVFIIVVKFEKAAPPVVMEDFTEYKYDKEKNKEFIRILDETYLPELLEKLWKLEGREKIEQPTRFEIIINEPQADLKGLAVHDPTEKLKRKVYDAIFRIVPEGLRVIQDLSEDNVIAMVCSDEVIKEEWIEKAREVIEDVKKMEEVE